MAFTKTWNEAEPGANDDLILGDDTIRDTRFALRERLAVDHNHKADETGDDYIGWHKKCSLLEQADLGTGAVVSGVGHPILGAQTTNGKAELTLKDEDNNRVQLTEGGVCFASYRDRGDADGWDYQTPTFVTDGTWRDLDLSSFAPAGTKAIYLLVGIRDDVAGTIFSFRKNGNANATNRSLLVAQAANVWIYESVWIACDSGRVVEYLGSDSSGAATTISNINVYIRGWSKG